MLTLLATTAFAAPTHAEMEAAAWADVGTAKHSEVGTVTIRKVTLQGIECFEGSAVTDVAPSKLLAVVADVEGAVRWSTAGVTEAKLLSNSGGVLEYYQYLDVPGWTFAADRFWFLKSTTEDTGDHAALRWSPLTNGGGHTEAYQKVKTEHPDAIEPTANVGSWIFDKKDDGTHVKYQVCTLPGGSIPTSIQNAATKKTLPDTVGDVVREARRR
ncbi:MAG: hypothetical protein KC621_24690 [Myxococcales bacterium]|nr:hypothetical protein [Myxococcales bacterium]